MSSPLDWTTPEGIEVLLKEVQAVHFGYPLRAKRPERLGAVVTSCDASVRSKASCQVEQSLGD